MVTMSVINLTEPEQRLNRLEKSEEIRLGQLGLLCPERTSLE